MNRTLRKTFLRVASIIALLAALSMAQVTTVDIVGTVTDHTGAVVPGAKITVTHAATNLARSMEASTNGDYTFSLLPLGGYSVSVEADGFKRFETRMSLAAGERGRVDAQMQLGDVNEVVEVSAQAQVLQTDSAT
ncbi:MAG: carboxypeptidase regulatory-like domain-containing protein, partial [Bryobacterales bacterium]|nr:carboxypeptidase regulatory-like domain-containing protein [Bryobacterales bacterium]